MCLAARPAQIAAPAPPPTAMDAGVRAVRDAQRMKQKKAGGYTGAQLDPALAASMTRATAPMKTLLGA